MSARDTLDLDFTQVLKALPLRPPVPAISIDTQIGGASAGNFIAFVRGGVARRAAAAPADAPILVVEDDEDVRRLLGRVLSMQGYVVRPASDFEQFKHAMRLQPLPRLVLLDVELPSVSGLHILHALRQHPQTAALPVVMVTSRNGNKDLSQALALGADGYVTKPLTVAVLRSIIHKILPPRN